MVADNDYIFSPVGETFIITWKWESGLIWRTSRGFHRGSRDDGNLWKIKVSLVFQVPDTVFGVGFQGSLRVHIIPVSGVFRFGKRQTCYFSLRKMVGTKSRKTPMQWNYMIVLYYPFRFNSCC